MLDLAAIKARAAARLADSAAPAAEVANPANRLMVAAKLETLKHGDNQHTTGDANLHVLNRADAAAAAGPISQLATLASSDDTDRSADAWCWPHSDAMNTAELARMAARLRQFSRRGINEALADRLADCLVKLDRDASGLRVCAECSRLTGADGQGWRCNAHRAAGVARDLPADLVTTPQRCPAFKESRL